MRISTFTVCFTIFKLTFIDILVDVVECAIAFSFAHVKFADVFCAIFPDLNSESVSHEISVPVFDYIASVDCARFEFEVICVR